MNIYKTNKQLKELSFQQLSRNMGLLIGATLLQQTITFFASVIFSSLVPVTSYIGYAINFIVIFIVQLLAFVLQSGLYLIYMNTACNIPCEISTLFEGFRSNTNKILKNALVLAAINSICNIPSEIMYTQVPVIVLSEATTTADMMAYYNSMFTYTLVSLGCAMLYFVLTLSFVPVFYMIWDYPDDDIITIFKRSFSVMKGNKLRYILLQLSFIPSILLSFFVCGIPLLWIIPLMNIASTNFYMDLMAVRNKTI